MTHKKAPVRTDDKSEFLKELVEGYTKWAKRKPEYAQAYEHMIFAFTTPPEEAKKD